MQPSLEPSLPAPALRRPLPASARWSRRVFGGLLWLSLLTLLLVVGLTVIGGIKKAHHTQAQAFQSWVQWRQTHCRFEGRLETGSFVCDTGQRYPVKLVRGKEVAEAPAGFLPR